MSENPVTGLCAFDGQRVDVERLRHLGTLHPLCSAAAPLPQFRMFADDGALWVEGEIDAFAIDHVWRALERLPTKTKVVIDLTDTALQTKSMFSIVEPIGSFCRAYEGELRLRDNSERRRLSIRRVRAQLGTCG
jgi:hypothetical protein